MKRSGKIKHYADFPSVTFYVVHFDDEEHPEFDRFLLKFEKDSKCQSDFNIIKAAILKIGNEGALERRFRPEKRASAIPLQSSKLRVYCKRISDHIVILGNGAVKTAKKAQDCPNVGPFFDEMNQVSRIFDAKVKIKKIRIEGKHIKGNIDFTINQTTSS